MANNRTGLQRSNTEEIRHWRESIKIKCDVEYEHPNDMYCSEIHATFTKPITDVNGQRVIEKHHLFVGKKVVSKLPDSQQSLLNMIERNIPKGGWLPSLIELKNSNYSGRAIR